MKPGQKARRRRPARRTTRLLLALAFGLSLVGAFVFSRPLSCRPRAFPGPDLPDGKLKKRLDAEPVIRVAVALGQSQAVLACATPCEAWTGPPSARLFNGDRLRLQVARAPRGFAVNGSEVEAEWLCLRPVGSGMVQIGDGSYPGEAYAVGQDEAMTLVNAVPMERYLAGVVAKEMRPTWPVEALKAQAVAARSYALWQMRWSAGRAHDVVSGSSSQRYAGGEADARVAEAVAATRGRALARDGQLTPGYYSSTCGGRTASPADVFDMKGLAYMAGVKCEFCSGSPHLRWELKASAEDVRRALAERGHDVDRVTALHVLRRAPDGRAREVRVFMGERSLDLSATAFRSAIGGYRLKSAWFSIESAAEGFRFAGQGFGHGVGMCQYGARGMAAAGARFTQILAKYYTGVSLALAYD
jgi:stage II sporulation protein D